MNRSVAISWVAEDLPVGELRSSLCQSGTKIHTELTPATLTPDSVQRASQMNNPSSTVLLVGNVLPWAPERHLRIYKVWPFSLHWQFLFHRPNNVRTAISRVHRTTDRESSLYHVCRSITGIIVNPMSPFVSITDLVISPVSL